MKYSGTLLKMSSIFKKPIEYSLPVGDQLFIISNYINKEIKIEFFGDIFCIKCNNKIKRSFAQGYCFPCFQSAPETSECILKPELCRAHEGIARDMEWAKKVCLNDHYVYLSLTSGLKVGVTRLQQVPTRWIDQGASQALILAKTPNRYYAGLIEVELKQYVSDKTAWQRMLKNEVKEIVNLVDEKNKLVNKLPSKLKKYVTNDEKIVNINYPKKKYPTKIKSLSLDKITIESSKHIDTIYGSIIKKLTGIKGQYLYLDNEYVFNIRKHQGYSVTISI